MSVGAWLTVVTAGAIQDANEDAARKARIVARTEARQAEENREAEARRQADYEEHLAERRAATRAGSPTRAPEPSSSADASPDEAPPTDVAEVADQAFIAQLESDVPGFWSAYPDGQLIDIGRAVCGDLDGGADPYGVAFTLAEGLDQDPVDMSAVVGAAIGAMCERHSGAW